VGGSRWTAIMTMGPVWLRYGELLGWPGSLSLLHDVPVRTAWSAAGVLGYAILVFWGVVGVWLWRERRVSVPLGAWLWFVVPLLPVSQIAFPLQNLMADRYLLLPVLALGLLAVPLVERAPRWGLAAVGVLVASFTIATAQRSALFADSVSLFADALGKTQLSALAPYQLGKALEDSGDEPGARAAYEEVLRRAPGASDEARRATNNLAKLYARAGRLAEAERVLRRGIGIWPEDRKMRDNLRKVLIGAARH
jgi:protein O-mannosyl-transferase